MLILSNISVILSKILTLTNSWCIETFNYVRNKNIIEKHWKSIMSHRTISFYFRSNNFCTTFKSPSIYNGFLLNTYIDSLLFSKINSSYINNYSNTSSGFRNSVLINKNGKNIFYTFSVSLVLLISINYYKHFYLSINWVANYLLVII